MESWGVQAQKGEGEAPCPPCGVTTMCVVSVPINAQLMVTD